MNQAFKVALVITVFAGIFAAGGITGLVVTAHVAAHRAELERQRWTEERGRQEQQAALDRQQQKAEQDKLAQMIAQLRQQVQAQAQAGPTRPAPRAPAAFGPQLMQRFIEQIQPSPAQLEQIRPMVFQAAEDLRRLRLDTAHRTEQTLESLQDQISILLTPDQRGRFDAMIERSREAFRQYNFQQQLRQQRQRQQERRSWRGEK